MSSIIKGTTPVIEFTFSDISIPNIVKAVLVIKQNNKTVIEKDKDTSIVGQQSISWRLTQEDTLRLQVESKAELMCDWKLNNSIRGRSHKLIVNVEESGKNEVI